VIDNKTDEMMKSMLNQFQKENERVLNEEMDEADVGDLEEKK